MKPHTILLAVASIAFPQGIAGAADPSHLSAKTISGGAFFLSEARGKVVIVNFWATWCAPCRAEMPALDLYYRQNRGKGLELLAISLDAGASVKQIDRVAHEFAFPVARIADTRMARSAIPGALPTTRIYGRDGRMRYASDPRRPVPLDAAALERIVAPLLAEATPASR